VNDPGWPPLGGTPTSIRLRDHDTTVAEVQVGRSATPRVCLLVHSALLDRDLWSRFAPHLAGNLCGSGAWRIVGYDLREHGAARTAPPITNLNLLADDLADLLQCLGIRRAHLVGLSLGGAVVQAISVARPELVVSTTVVGSSSRFPTDVMDLRADLSGATVASRLDDTMERWFLRRTLRENGDAVAYARSRVLATPPETWSRTWRALGGFDVLDQLSAIATPVLAVAGASDTASPPAALKAIADSVQNGRLVVLDDAAHLMALERPEALAAHVGTFLRDLDD
jgi:pimeloyl-ACP methyl ester carboxylesterase